MFPSNLEEKPNHACEIQFDEKFKNFIRRDAQNSFQLCKLSLYATFSNILLIPKSFP